MVTKPNILHIMRGETPPKFGAVAGNILEMNRTKKGSKKMKVILIVDNQEFTFQDAIVNIRYCNNTCNVHIGDIGTKVPEINPIDQIAQNCPDVVGFVGPNTKQEQFLLQGDDLDTFIMTSPFRDEKNTSEEVTKGVTDAQLETNLYDIMQNNNAVTDAIKELVEQERALIDRGYKVVKVGEPVFKFSVEDPEQNEFKLVEIALLVEKSEETDVSNKETGSIGRTETESAN